MSSFLNNHKVRGLRNNNPGNLIYTSIGWQGKIPLAQNKDKHFEQFVSVEYGLRAMALDLINDIRKGKNTITSLINEYAPPHENNTKSYIDSVSKSVGIAANTKLSLVNGKLLLPLIRAILKVELGAAHKEVTDSMIVTALGMLPQTNTAGVKVDTTDSKKIKVDWNLLKDFGVGLFLVFYSAFTLSQLIA